MDFFGYQDQAHSNTRKLVVLFILAVIAIILVIYFFTVQLFIPPQGFGESGKHDFLSIESMNLRCPPGMSLGEWLVFRKWWYPELFLVLSLGITALIFGSAFYKTGELKKGGRSIATLLGGRLVRPDTENPDERRLLNVVEEMAIASGTPVPDVFLMELERGINAFAAGFSHKDMVIGVTEGCLRLLTRDELQGVMAHEFSHILRGDMRLNMRLMGTVFGITMISTIGYFILRGSFYGSSNKSGSSKSGKKGGGGAQLGIILFGALLYVVGYVGVFFGNLIKSAIARQREFLADASATQFTRNPAGLAGALKKVGGLAHGSKLRSPHAQEASHFYFCNGLSRSYFQFLATHPPLAERIRRLDPAFTGEFPKSKYPKSLLVTEKKFPRLCEGDPPLSLKAELDALDPEQFVDTVGTLTTDQIDYASGLRKNLSGALIEAVKEPVGASAVVLSLLLGQEESVRNLQLDLLRKNAPAAVFGDINTVSPAVRSLEPVYKIPLVDWALPALRGLSDRQYEQFRALTESLISADDSVDLFEFCLQRMLHRNLDAQYHKVPLPKVKYLKTEDVLPEALSLLSTLAWTGQSSEHDAQEAFSSGVMHLNLSRKHAFTLEPKQESIDFEQMDRTLERLHKAGPYVKKNLLFACAHTVSSDGKILESERELLRAIADSLDLPVPPFIHEQIH